MAVADMGDRVARRKGRVSVAALPSLAAGWLPGIFAEFRRANPGYRISEDWLRKIEKR